MFMLFITALAAAPTMGAIDSSRSAFVACLKEAASAAKPPEVTVDGCATFAKTRCAAQETALTGAMVAFDVKNGSSRKSAAEGAQLMLDDYLETAKSNYAARHSN